MNKVALYKLQGAEVEKGLARFLGLYVLLSVNGSVLYGCSFIRPGARRVLDV